MAMLAKVKEPNAEGAAMAGEKRTEPQEGESPIYITRRGVGGKRTEHQSCKLTYALRVGAKKNKT